MGNPQSGEPFPTAQVRESQRRAKMTNDQPQDAESNIGNRLRAARVAQGLTQSQAGKLIGIHRPSVAESELGRRRVHSDELLRYSQLYEVTIDYLLSGITSPADQPRLSEAEATLDRDDGSDTRLVPDEARLTRQRAYVLTKITIMADNEPLIRAAEDELWAYTRAEVAALQKHLREVNKCVGNVRESWIANWRGMQAERDAAQAQVRALVEAGERLMVERRLATLEDMQSAIAAVGENHV